MMTENEFDTDMLETDPLRRCIVTRESCPKEQMIRFVIDPENRLVPDLAENLPGRGLWVMADAAHLATAIEKKIFGRAAKRQMIVPDQLIEMIEHGLRIRCRDQLALARRAGKAIPGFEKVREALKSGSVGAVMIARDAADDGRQKITALAGAVSQGQIPILSVLDGGMMGQVFGRDHLVHVALLPGGLATRLVTECRRLHGIMGPK